MQKGGCTGKEIRSKLIKILTENGKRELSMNELDMVNGGYTEADLAEEDRAYLNKLVEELGAATYERDEKKQQKYCALINQFHYDMIAKYG